MYLTGERDRAQTEEALWIAHTLFARNKVSGSTGNISFKIEDIVYISCSGSCFATLKENDFVKFEIQKNGDFLACTDKKASKEAPLHLTLYRNNPELNAVIHTHSFYATLWSCLKHQNPDDVVPRYTPYLEMKLGRVKEVPYAEPGSQKLFQCFEERVGAEEAYLLKNHGPVVGSRSLMDAFYRLEELEESVKIAWYLRGEPEDCIQKIPHLVKS